MTVFLPRILRVDEILGDLSVPSWKERERITDKGRWRERILMYTFHLRNPHSDEIFSFSASVTRSHTLDIENEKASQKYTRLSYSHESRLAFRRWRPLRVYERSFIPRTSYAWRTGGKSSLTYKGGSRAGERRYRTPRQDTHLRWSCGT